MNKLVTSAIFLIALVFYGRTTFAQQHKILQKADSLKSAVKQNLNIDSLDNKLHLKDRFKNVASQTVNVPLLKKKIDKDSLIKKPKIGLKDFSIENSGQYIKSERKGPFPSYVNNVTIAGQLLILGFPINIDVANNADAFRRFNPSESSLFKFNFNRNSLTQLYQPELSRYKNFKQDKLSGKNIEGHLKQKIQTKLMAASSKKISQNSRMMEYLNKPEQVQELLKMKPEALKLKVKSLLSDAETKATDRLKQINTDSRNSVEAEINKETDEVCKVIQELKADLDENGLDQSKIDLFQKFIENKITQKELENFFVSELSKEPKTKGLQKLYSRVQSFKAGQFGSAIPGSFMNPDVFQNGFSLSVKTLRGPVTVGLSTSKDLDQPKDMGFNSSSYTYPKLYSYISIPTTNFAIGTGKLTWVGVYDKQFSNSLNKVSTAVPKNNLAFTLSQNLNFNHFGKVTVDVSKSATQYKNLSNIGLDQLFIDRNTMGNYFRDDFLETMSLGLNHELDLPRTGLNSRVYFSYSGIGYQNPGQQGYGNLNMRFGGNLKKKFLNNKLTLNLRSDVKNTPLGVENGAHWRNYNVQIDGRYRISKAFNFNLKYGNNGVNKVAESSNVIYSSEKLQMDLNANYKIGLKQSFSHLTLGQQVMRNANVITPSNFFTANYMQNIMFENFSLSANLLYNRELNTVTAIGNMLNTDASCQYTLFRDLNVSSGITYLNNENVAKQVGIRQNIQVMLKKHFDVNAYVDFRKNLINPLYPDLFSTGRAEFSVRYYFDKQ